MNNSKLELLSTVLFKKYKSFQTDGLFRIPLHNNVLLIIGRNNSGKSSVVDVVEAALDKESYNPLIGLQNLSWSFVIKEENLKEGYSIPKIHETPSKLYLYSRDYLGKRITLQKDSVGPYEFATYQEDIDYSVNEGDQRRWNKVANSYEGALDGVCIRRINADRDIVPEVESDEETVGLNGAGATNLIRKFLLLNTYDEFCVERTILDELNKITGKDGSFTNIRIQQIKAKGNYRWEIFLEENGERFALSKSGSGLKTILLILINLYLIPKTKEYQNKQIVYAFEEVENNLHPELQRRIFDYLYQYSIKHDIKIIITTHSHIAINTFYGKEKISICHVMKNKGKSEIVNIDSNAGKNDILDDLGVKASDMLQSNGIIWVEGPSDRIYILSWLKVFTDFNLREGYDFQFMYYGGKLLSHYTVDSTEKNDLIDILTTNRHAAIIIDSDKTAQSKPINDTKKRIQKEFKERGLFCWITKGKEIENYLSVEAINQVHNSKLTQIDKYGKFPDKSLLAYGW